MIESKIIKEVEFRGTETIRELQDAVKELRRDVINLDESSEDYEKTVNDLAQAEYELKINMRATKEGVIAATGSYNDLVDRMAALKRVWRDVTDEATRARIGLEIKQINDQLKEFDSSIGNNQRKVGSYEDAIRNVFKTPQQEIKALRVQLAQLEEGTKEYNETFMRMADLTTKVTKQQELLKYSSADLGNILGNLAGVAAGVAGGFSAVNAAMGLMGNQDGDVQQAMLKVQQFMALVQGLSKLEGLKDKIAGLWKGIGRFIEGFRGGTAAVAEFEKATKEAAGTTEQVTGELNAQAVATQTNNAAGQELTKTTNQLQEAYRGLRVAMGENNAAMEQEIALIRQSNLSRADQEKEIDRVKAKYADLNKEMELNAKGSALMRVSTKDITKAGAEQEKQLVKTNNVLKLTRQNLKGAADATVAYTAGTKAAAVGTKVLTAAVNGLKIALSAIGIGLIIAALTALIGLLGKGLKPVWDWITGATAAKNATDALKKSTEELNKTLTENGETMEFQSRLMDAQGKAYDEIYKYKKEQISASLALARATLEEANATAHAIGSKKLAKEKYKEFREEMQNLINTIEDYKKQLKVLDQEREIHLAQEQTNAANKAAGAYKTQLAAAEKLYKELQDWYKTDRQKLKETYDANRVQIEKYIKNKEQRNKALLLLDKKYYEDLKALTRNAMDAIYNTYLGQEQRRLALLDVWSPKYLQEAKKVLDEEQKIALNSAAKRVGFEEKTQAQIDKMDAKTKDEYLKRKRLFNNEKWLIDQEYQQKQIKLEKENRIRVWDENRKLIELKNLQIKSDEELLEAEINLAAYDMTATFQREGESVADMNTRLEEAYQRYEALIARREEIIKQNKQLKLDNDALEAGTTFGKQSMQYYDAQIEAAKYYAESMQRIQGESDEQFRMRHLQALDELADLEKARLQQRLDNYTNLAQGIGNIMGSIAEWYQEEIRAQKEADGDYNAESKRKFEYVKGLQIAQATINTISGAIAAFMGAQELGQPWGLAIGIAQAAAVTAAGAVEIAKIKNTKLDGNSSVGNSARYSVAVPTIPDFVPEGTTNLTGQMETEDLKNALASTQIVVSVTEINDAQDKLRTRVSEATF